MVLSRNQDEEAVVAVSVALLQEANNSDINKAKYGGWRSASFIIISEFAERFAYRGINSNLMTYLTGPLHLSTLTAATNINVWSGVVLMLPIVGALVSDSYVCRYQMILYSCLLYTLGLGSLTLSTFLGNENNNLESPPPSKVIVCFISLYLVAIAQAGHRPCVQAFGADQFDGRGPEESKSLSSFFNWWYFGMCFSSMVSVLVLDYIQDNLNWSLGFGIPCALLALSLTVFLLGTKMYRYGLKKEKKNPVFRVYQVFLAAARNWRTIPSSPPTTHQLKFLDRALISFADSDDEKISITEVEEAKTLLQTLPVWTACLVYGVVYAQYTTFFTKQSSTMDRSVGSKFKIPAASLQVLTSLSLVLLIPIYDRVFVPLARAITGKPSGITMLQRIGCGIIISMLAMVVAAVVETRRLRIALDSEYIGLPTAIVPMRVWWLVPQYLLIGVSEVFAMIGMQEFFYDQMPHGLKSFGAALSVSTLGAGSFLSSFLISFIGMATSVDGTDSWFSSNLNLAHLDYFYWFLAVLSAADFIVLLLVTKSYVYNRGNEDI